MAKNGTNDSPNGGFLRDPYQWRGQNGIGTGKVPIGHFRRETLTPGKESDTRPELPASQSKDGRRKGG